MSVRLHCGVMLILVLHFEIRRCSWSFIQFRTANEWMVVVVAVFSFRFFQSVEIQNNFSVFFAVVGFGHWVSFSYSVIATVYMGNWFDIFFLMHKCI